LPRDFSAFDVALSAFCPRRHELRDELPYGSLENLARKHGVQRHGAAHTAGSDALLTLELYLRVGTKGRQTSETTRWSNNSSWSNEQEAWDNSNNNWYQSWDSSWEQPRWESTAWAFPFPASATPSLPWLSVVPVPALTAGTPMPAAAFWGVAAHGLAMKLPPVAPVDAAAAMRKMGWWTPDSAKVLEI